MRGGHDLTLQRPHLLLGRLASFELLLHLLFGGLQGLQLFGRVLHSLAQDLLLLRQQLGVAGVQFQQLVDLPQLGGKVAGFLVDVLQRLAQFCGIAADLDG